MISKIDCDIAESRDQSDGFLSIKSDMLESMFTTVGDIWKSCLQLWEIDEAFPAVI